MALRQLTFVASLLFLVEGFAVATGGDYDIAPEPLSYYLKRLPAKSISQVLEDSGPLPKPGTTSVINATELNADFAHGPSPELVKKIDVLLEKARTNYSGPIDDNILQDLRDLAAGTGPAAEVADYAHWRLANPDLSALKGEPPPEVEQKLAAASGALKPHWLYLLGAIHYKAADDTTSETFFDRVLTEFPNTARVEAALFMKGRCRLSQAVDADPWANPNKKKTPEASATRDQAKALFQDYLTRFPQGRYRIDVIGWIGAADYRSSNFASALGSYIQQIESSTHPEDIPAATVMIEKCLYHLRDSNSTDVDEVAKHPAVALALTYFAVNTALAHDWYGTNSDSQAQTWRHELLPKLATAVLNHKDLYRGKLGQDRYVAILAHAASDNGDQDGALKLVRLNGPDTDNDDLAFVRALVLQRTGHLDESIAAYRRFLKTCPASPLAPGARYRLGLALHEQKQDGDALVELAALRGNHLPLHSQPLPTPESVQSLPSPAIYDSEESTRGSAIRIDYSGAPSEEVDQTMDAILNFAPISSLETALKGSDPAQADLRHDLRAVLQERSLAQEDYDGAARFAESPELKAKFETLAAQVRSMGHKPGPSTAKTAAALADYWNRQAKLLVTSPLDSSEARAFVYSSDALAANLRRRTNGLTLDMEKLDEALESRDEQRHAVEWWNRVLENTGAGDIAPRTLWQILEARRRIVETSPYTQQRAIETNAADTARQDYDRLLKDFPQSPEAQRLAAYWTFPGPDDLKNKNDDYYEPRMAFVGIDIRALIGGGFVSSVNPNDWYKALGARPDYRPEDASWKTTCDVLADFPETSRKMDAASFKNEVQRQLDSARPLVQTMEQAGIINCLEDLNALAQVPNLDAGVRSDYVSLRVGELSQVIDAVPYGTKLEKLKPSANLAAQLRQNPAAQSIADFVHFVGLVDLANMQVQRTLPSIDKDGQPYTYTTRDFAKLAEESDAFLKKHPKSPKREAAMVQRLRGIVYTARPRFLNAFVDWPAAHSWAGESLPRPVSDGPFDQAAFTRALHEYDAEFPQGAYIASMTALRADAAIIQHHWGLALDNLIALHDPQTRPEFQDQVAVELCEIFNGLDDSSQRHDILEAILKRPAARDLLASYLGVGGVPYLKDYLLAQLKTP